MSSSSSSVWSLDDYCQSQLLQQQDWSVLPASSRQLLESFQLPPMHPFCQATTLDDFYTATDIPPMGPLLHHDYHHHFGDVLLTHLYRVLPALMAMGELWLRLFASALAPLGIAYLMYQEMAGPSSSNQQDVATKPQPKTTTTTKNIRPLSLIIMLTVASSVVLMTDTLYILEYGPRYGATLLIVSSVLALRACTRHTLTKTLLIVWSLKLLAGYLIYHPNNNNSNNKMFFFGDPLEAVTNVQEGLYYNSHNPFIQHIVDAWPEPERIYTPESGATPWMPTGDSRTGLPFLLNKGRTVLPPYQRLWLETTDQEYVALDLALPREGHSTTKPMYLVLHGLNGGSHEEYVMEFTHRRLQEGSTVVVMVARGLMDLPIRGWNIFHGARVDDVHVAAKAIRQVVGPDQLLAGVGYSMGAIILSNYVARSGNDCPLDAAVAISGGLDMRLEEDFVRAQRLWQPMLAQELRDTFLVTKWGERVRKRLSLEDMKRSMRAVHVTEIDMHAVAPYNGFDNLTHYYMEMSALGDIPLDRYLHDTHLPDNARIHNIAIPFCVVHSLDDPLVSWRTVAANQGLMHPSNLTQQVQSGNLLVLLTKSGGHVGWPLGWAPFLFKWKWMNDVAMTFVQAVASATKEHGGGTGECLSGDASNTEECSNDETNSPSQVDEEPTNSNADDSAPYENSDDVINAAEPAEQQDETREEL